MVLGVHYRHPAVPANMAATLDIVSGGRLELGIGAGGNEEDLAILYLPPPLDSGVLEPLAQAVRDSGLPSG